MWQHNYEPIAGSLGISALVAAIPIVVLFVMLGVLRKPAWMSAMAALVSALVVALFAYGMPVQLAMISTIYGAAYGVFPIAWIVFASIMLYRLAVDTGKFEIIKDSVGSLTDDRRLQAMFIAFSFGAFIEGAAGFGAPVAVSGAMLAGLGFNPFYAAGICLLANTAPVAFGSIGIPVTTLANVTGLPVLALSGMVGMLCAMISIVIPGYLIVVMAGSKRALEVLAGDRRLRRLVRRRAVLRLAHDGPRADGHPELADLHHRDGRRAQAVEADEHHAARGRQAGVADAWRGTRAARSSWPGCRTCCSSSSCSSGVSRRSRRRSTGGPTALAGVAADARDGPEPAAGARPAQRDRADSAGGRQAGAVRRDLRDELAERVGHGVLPGDSGHGAGAARAAAQGRQDLRRHLQAAEVRRSSRSPRCSAWRT